jgi:hypothetical protein
MNIKSINNLKYNTVTKTYNIYYPQLLFRPTTDLNVYYVQKYEAMRIDLVMLSMYQNDPYVLEHIDVILFINGIDNPLNILEGDVLYFPEIQNLDSWRFSFEPTSKSGANIRKALSVPNKTTRIDSNRKKFLENAYSLPPVVLSESKPPVRLEDGKIVIGGVN